MPKRSLSQPKRLSRAVWRGFLLDSEFDALERLRRNRSPSGLEISTSYSRQTSINLLQCWLKVRSASLLNRYIEISKGTDKRTYSARIQTTQNRLKARLTYFLNGAMNLCR